MKPSEKEVTTPETTPIDVGQKAGNESHGGGGHPQEYGRNESLHTELPTVKPKEGTEGVAPTVTYTP